MRDVGKSMSKELVGLQVKLDSLTFVKSETLSETIEESQEDDDGKIRNTALEPQVEWQNEEKPDELNNNQEVEAAYPIHDMKPEQLVEQISGEFNMSAKVIFDRFKDHETYTELVDLIFFSLYQEIHGIDFDSEP
ncbi:unnamed protein product [Lactuca saligna]|uniref:Uncharacterized protein n=1 Tax=Lactuca saligna TaxID=75948 RepID=A0AA36EFQ0_LACSI|nr:unnamed protein product [Lactuca saligna]